MPKIVDPDNLAQTISVLFSYDDSNNRTIALASNDISGSSNILPTVSGSNTGVTLQCLYTFCKEQWKSDDNLIKIPFPLISITKTQFDFVNSWDMVDDRSRYLIRDGAWSVRDSSNTSQQEWVGIVTLGSLGDTDQVYYQQSSSGQPANFQMPGPVNHAVPMYSASAAIDHRDYMKLFVREWGKTYANASVQDDLAVTTMEYVVYSLPLTNATDIKVTEAISASVTGSPYNEVTITYLSGSGFATYAGTGVTYPAGAVVYDPIPQSMSYWITNAGGTTNSVTRSTDTGATWVLYSGQRLIGTETASFNVIIDAGAGKNNTAAGIYTRIQYMLRTGSDIDDGTDLPPRSGSTADSLLRFLGDTLITSNGVYIDNFQDGDTNSINFYDVSGSLYQFPYVAAGTLLFNDNLKNDPSGSYYMFFTTNYGTATAIIVNDNDGLPITGSTSGSAGVTFTFDYDNNAQGSHTPGTDAPVTVVAIGLNTAQYVSTTSTLTRSKANNISLVSSLERNYANPA